MKQIFLLKRNSRVSVRQVGGKAAALLKLLQTGVRLPKTACLTTVAYNRFLAVNGLREKIHMAMNAKDFNDMRWEEIWDVSLRIRQLFLTTRLPAALASAIHDFVRTEFGPVPLAVRSSATEEDSAKMSFAGLHESYLNIRSREQLERAIRKVWASLWSDRALLYRQELRLAVGSSAMAVVIQELLDSDVAGVGFTHDPLHRERMVIEAVYGLNQGLVDGDVQPDRYQIRRQDHSTVTHSAPEKRDRYATVCRTGGEGVEIAPLPPDKKDEPPLDSRGLAGLVQTMSGLEKWFKTPLDIEWCRCGERLYILQARPITTLDDEEGTDSRSWYLSLHRSFANLQGLWQTIEQQMLPEMEAEFGAMAAVDLASLSRAELAQTIRSRFARLSHWSKRYWADCIPFAHGVRLFGEVFNEVMAPADPYQFVLLLSGEQMLSTGRNRMLKELAAQVRNRPEIKHRYEGGGFAAIADEEFCNGIEAFEHHFGNFFITQDSKGTDSRDSLVRVILQYATLQEEGQTARTTSRQELEDEFFLRLDRSALSLDGPRLLALARASYRLRDDDNIYMGKLEQQLSLAVLEGRSRLKDLGYGEVVATPEEIAALLEGKQLALLEPGAKKAMARLQHEKGAALESSGPAVRARQLPGQPASRGFCRALARVIERPEQMTEFRVGEVLVVDSIDPNMTFLAPLASAIIERRGGMLIHGAIIAREYGIPCVTGVSGATRYIRTGDMVTVDGFLGLVVVDGDRQA